MKTFARVEDAQRVEGPLHRGVHAQPDRADLAGQSSLSVPMPRSPVTVLWLQVHGAGAAFTAAPIHSHDRGDRPRVASATPPPPGCCGAVARQKSRRPTTRDHPAGQR
jgi:hypothetical protein